MKSGFRLTALLWIRAGRGGAGHRERTREAFGRHINPHLFRHIAATEIATFAPHDVSDAAAVLGHSSLDTTRQYYIHARALHAVQAYQQLVIAKMKAGERGAALLHDGV